MTTSQLIENERQKINMNGLQFNALLGTVLADAHIGASGAVTARIQWNHGWTQHEYCLRKYELLKEFATKPPCRKPNPGYGEEWCCLNLKATHLYFLLRQLCYTDDGRKQISEEYLELIAHPIALAWMFLDNGSRQKGHHAAALSMHAFAKEDIELFQKWLESKWGITGIIQTVRHTSTGKEGQVLRFNKEAFLKLSALIEPYVPESMRYKVAIITQACSICGQEFPKSLSNWCSEECAAIGLKQNKHDYWQRNKEHFIEKSREWSKEHREEINAAAREAYRNITPEKRQELNEYAREYREQNREKINAYRRERRARLKGDPDYEAKLKEERRRYHERKKADPERHQKSLAASRERRKKPEVRAKEAAYLRERRAAIYADPVAYAEYLEQSRSYDRKRNADPEKHAHINEIARASRSRKREFLQAYPEQLEKAREKARLAQRARLAAIYADPDKHAAFQAQCRERYHRNLEASRRKQNEAQRRQRREETPEQREQRLAKRRIYTAEYEARKKAVKR